MFRVFHGVSVPARGDFLVDDSISFEVGGMNKDDGQIRGIDNSSLLWTVLRQGVAGGFRSGCSGFCIELIHASNRYLAVKFYPCNFY